MNEGDVNDLAELSEDVVRTSDNIDAPADRSIDERAIDDADLATLLESAFTELVARNGAEGRSQVKDGARFLVVLDDGSAVGCGAVQAFEAVGPHPGDGESKRMYVLPKARGRGFARALLAGLEDLARTAGHPVLRLSTGDRQPEAIALYEASGYGAHRPVGQVRRPTSDALLREGPVAWLALCAAAEPVVPLPLFDWYRRNPQLFLVCRNGRATTRCTTCRPGVRPAGLGELDLLLGVQSGSVGLVDFIRRRGGVQAPVVALALVASLAPSA
ncbi:GNAT family N-acetyltransferase [Kribbella sp. ALI-6-A]|uniref:GNAT family N-acetyltransferase n=1 Tax=Kribbella sp. ALI-6-A TaxID=1933817 RepID=UPI001ED9F653|nr:GNAT family N-acetyltransferase [Kribbella sp. ALI-6-A]